MKTAALLLLVMTSIELAHCANLTPSKPSLNLNHHPQVQYVHDKDDSIKSEQASEEEQPDPYQILNEMKPERLPPQFGSWNPYQQHESMPNNKFLPFFGYPQPIFIPYPLIISPEMLYPFGGQNALEDSMSRASSRRPSFRNSPIYYVRLPPTPYMFIPGLGYTSQPGTFAPNFSPILPYNSYPTTVPLSSIFNLPVNFLANGKPTGIYQMGSPNDLQNQLPQLAPQRPTPSPIQYRPSYLPQQSYIAPTDTKMTNLKRPFIFNGRPEDIYVLRNNFNPMQSLYQDPLSGYY